jgi:hypothetical protein
MVSPQKVEVQRVLAEDTLLTQVAEFSVTDRAGGIPVVHGVAASLGGVGRLHHDVAAQVCHFAAVGAAAEVHALQRLVERDLRSVDGLDEALFRAAAPAVLADVVSQSCRRDDDPVADAPAGDGLGERHYNVTDLGSGTELDPGAIRRSPVKIHAAAATDDSGTTLAVHAVEGYQSDERAVFRLDWPVGSANVQGRPRLAGRRLLEVDITVEAVVRGVVAGLDLDEAYVETGVAVGSEGQRAGDVDRSDGRVGHDIVDDAVSRADLDPRTRRRQSAAFPGVGRRPRTALRGAGQGCVGGASRGRHEEGGEERQRWGLRSHGDRPLSMLR